jgi:hypothetical protein
VTQVACDVLGAVVQLVRISACHAEGRGFESRPLRQALLNPYKSTIYKGFFILKPAFNYVEP